MNRESRGWVMHVDMDAFFASVEQRDNPEFRHRPVIVGALPGGRGVVATCSYEARAFGIRSAMPISEAWRRCPGAIYLRPDMPRYVEASRKIMQLLQSISPVVEPVSIDEAYLDASGLERLNGELESIASLTRQKIRETVGLGCSVGIGPNRLIAKLASEYRKPNGQTVVRHEEVLAFLDPMPVSNLRGVGKQTDKIVQKLGIQTVHQLRQYSLEILSAHFGRKGGRHLYDQARGIASSRVGGTQGRKSISKETTFKRDVTRPRQLREKLRQLSAEVGRSARHKSLKGRVVNLKIRIEGFETHTRQCRLPRAVNADGEIFGHAWKLYEQSGLAGRSVRLIGVGISDFGSEEPMSDLFESSREREEKLYSTMDEITDKYGINVLSRGIRR